MTGIIYDSSRNLRTPRPWEKAWWRNLFISPESLRRQVNALLSKTIVHADRVVEFGPKALRLLDEYSIHGPHKENARLILRSLGRVSEPSIASVIEELLQPPAPTQLTVPFSDNRPSHALFLASAGEQGMAALEEATRRESPRIRSAATFGFSQMADDPDKRVRALAALLSLAGDVDTRVRWCTMQALGSFVASDPAAQEALFAGLKDEEGDVKWQAVLAIRKHPHLVERAIPCALDWLRGSDATEAFFAAELLATAAEPPTELIPLLIAGIQRLRDEPQKAFRLIGALARHGDRAKEALPIIAEIWRHVGHTQGPIHIYNHDAFSYTCTHAMTEIGGEEAIPYLLKGLEHKHLKNAASSALSTLRPGEQE